MEGLGIGKPTRLEAGRTPKGVLRVRLSRLPLMDDVLKPCRRCRGSGTDPDLPQRYTCGGHHDRSCKGCNGEGYLIRDGPAFSIRWRQHGHHESVDVAEESATGEANPRYGGSTQPGGAAAEDRVVRGRGW